MRENLLKKQPTWGLRRAQGTGQKSATPATLTKVILVLLTMFLLPSAAWGQITVAGNSPDQSGNITGTGITGTGTVTFNAETSTLTLNGATIDGSISYSGTDALTIALIGENTMNCGSSSMAFVSTNEVSLSFSTNSTDNGSLTISDYPSYNFDASKISTFSSKFTQISCSEGLVAVSVGSGTIIISNSYRINIGGVTVTTLNADKIEGSNISGTGTVKYVHDATNNSGTLYLTGVTISETGTAAISIPTSLLKLTINIQGSNTIKTTDNSAVIMCNRIDGSNTVEFSGTGSLTLERGVETTPYGGVTEYLTVNGSSYKDGLVPTYLPEGTTSLATATKAVIAKPYGLTVANVEVTSANLNTETGAITGLDNVTFTPATNTLKLSNAVISGSIYTTLESLIIDITNTNSIATSGSKNGIVSTTNTGTLTFTGTGSLEISSDCSVIRGFTAIEGLNLETKTPYEIYNNGYYRLKDKAAADSTGVKWLKVIQETTYPIWIAGNQVTNSNASKVLGDETVAFDGVDKLTLSGASIDCQSGDVHYPVTSTIKDLKVNLIKSSTFNILHSYEAFKYAGGENGATLTFSTVDPSDYNNLGSFTIFFENDYVHNPAESNISSGYTIKVSEGETSTEIPNDFNWNWNNNQDTSVSGWMGHKYNAAGAYLKLFYLQVYNLWLSTNRFYYPNGLSPASGITFDPDPSTPTLTYNYGDDSYHVYSGLSELTLKIGCNNESNQANYRMRAVSFGKPNDITATIAEKGNLILAKDDSEGEFRFLGDGTNSVIRGFTSVDFGDFVVLSDGAKYNNGQLVDASGVAMTTATLSTNPVLPKPEMYSESSDETIQLGLTISNSTVSYGTLKYSIVYADNSEGVTDAVYEDDTPPTINKPATVTAWLQLNDMKSEVAKGKYFGLKNKAITIAEGDIYDSANPLDVLTPAIEEGDGIYCTYSSEEDEVVACDYENAKLEAKGTGSGLVFVFAEPTNPDNIQTYVLNNDGLELKVNVGGNLNEIFAANNNYGTFYNTSTTTYAVPEGMKAYVITGADPKTGTVTTAETTVLPPNTPVLMEKGSAKAFTYIPATSGTAPSNNILLYTGNTDVQATEGSNLYVLYNDKFVKVTTGTRILSQKSYLKLNTSSGTRSYYDIDGSDGTTGIREVKSEGVKGEKWNDGEWYTLQGQRVTKPTKPGLYILNGKKVVIK